MRFRIIGVLIVSVFALFLSGCGEDAEQEDVPKSKLGKVSAEPQRPGDPQAGHDALLNRAVVTCGLPYSAYEASAGDPDPKLLIAGRTGRNAALPYSLTAFTSPSGVELVTANCLGCHAATFNGEMVIGLGNEFLDFTSDPVVAVESAGAYVNGEAEAAEWRRWADRIGAIAPYMMTNTVGVNPANNLTLALLAHRDPETLAWSDAPLLDPPPERPLPVSVPPWWNVGKKHAMFYNAEGRGDHVRFMMLSSTTCTDTVEEATAIDDWFTDVRAYLAALEPPDYPFAVDHALTEQGRKLFEANCKRCHGIYGEDPRYPNRVVGLEKVGTDPALAEVAYKDADRFIRWYNRSFYGETSRVAPALGYVAPPLDAVWATAPYLHNGSVPTLEALLDTSKRPRYWRFASDRPAFDEKALGWAYVQSPHGKDGAMSWDERYRIYDTSLMGYSNEGHTFGDELSDAERAALLEYLKTL
ncbi:MAG: c-type cytochrome [Pseudomonadota bacterium]|nr:c-type cytochrome [Pseudomonadota bacterium]